MKKYIVTASIFAVIMGGTVASAAYFSSSQKDALMKEGLTNNQVTSLDTQLVACRDLISKFDSKPEQIVTTTPDMVTNAEFNPTNPGFGTTTLRLGSKGTEVIALQKFLITAGYMDVIADGTFGLPTEGALMNWQKRTGLSRDGVFGPTTRSFAISTAPVIATIPSADRPLWCQGTWNCTTGGWQCVASTATVCNVYCVPDPQNHPCRASDSGIR